MLKVKVYSICYVRALSVTLTDFMKGSVLYLESLKVDAGLHVATYLIFFMQATSDCFEAQGPVFIGFENKR